MTATPRRLWDANDTTGATTEDKDRTVTTGTEDWDCPATSPDGFFCTANKGHKGPHVAGGAEDVVFAVWESTDGE